MKSLFKRKKKTVDKFDVEFGFILKHKLDTRENYTRIKNWVLSQEKLTL